MSFDSPSAAAVPPLPSAPEATARPPLFGMMSPNSPKKGPKAKSMMPTFLGEDATPTSPFGGKTLLGQ